MILFHGTNREFDAFSSEFLHTNPDRHENGRLGVWVTTDPELAVRFGRILLAVETPGDRVFDLEVRALLNMGKNAPEDQDVFGDFRRNLINRSFDVLAIREADGSAPTRVILDPERCRIVGRALANDWEAVEIVRAMATVDSEQAPRLRAF